MFGNKYVSFNSPKEPSRERITSQEVIEAASVTTEFDTLFETVTAIAEKVDPVKFNATLTATAEALTGLGERFGESLERRERDPGRPDPRMPQLRNDT